MTPHPSLIVGEKKRGGGRWGEGGTLSKPIVQLSICLVACGTFDFFGRQDLKDFF